MNEQKGIVLFEVLMGAVLGVIIFSAAAFTLYYLILLNDTVRFQSRIQHDISAIMERIESTSLANLNASYPAGDMADATGSEIRNILGGYQVPGEAINITYDSTTSNPRQITLTARWNDRGRQKTFAINTFKRG